MKAKVKSEEASKMKMERKMESWERKVGKKGRKSEEK